VDERHTVVRDGLPPITRIGSVIVGKKLRTTAFLGAVALGLVVR